MISPINFENKTGFNQIRELVALRCLSDPGRERTVNIGFTSDYDLICRLLGETREFLTILDMGLPFPSEDYLDLSPALNRLRTPGSWILPEELSGLRLSLKTIAECISFFHLPSALSFTHLRALAGDLEIPSGILREIDRIQDEKGLIRDNASPELARIRKDIRNKAKESEKIIGQMMIQARRSGWTSEDADITLSDGRLVIPLISAHKRRIKGVIHDESATGHTVYLEPEACIEINNEIRELESAERREIIHILTLFSDFLRPELEILFQGYQFLGEMDFIRAKALLAQEIGGKEPVVLAQPLIRWKAARHPLLYLSHVAKNKPVVPLDIELTPTGRILVITGPNAGGKSVCLKTVGLLQYMLQCGLLIPLDSDSETGIFSDIFIDIGDEQSLENDLSTYSSHLMNLAYFLENCSPSTLFLVDELGTGTDPSLGGTLAEATLEKLSETGTFGVVTTHYSNLKLLAGKVPGIVNGAMLFDMDQLKPLYKLLTGKPGSSFTFEIARRIGFPEEVIELAKSKAGKTHLDFERQLQEVETEKLHLEKQLKEFQVADVFLGELIEKYEKNKEDLERSKKEILEKARQEAKELLDQSNKMIEKTIREIKESQAETQRTKLVRSEINQFRQTIASPQIEQSQKTSEQSTAPEARKWKRGDRVSIEGRPGSGMVLRIKTNQALIDFDGLKISIPVEKLQMPKEQSGRSSKVISSIIKDLNEKAVNFKLTLDVRGKMADEAIMLVQKYIDDAYLLRIKEVSILHGKGEGILRKAIRDYLSGLEEVESYADAHIEHGGAGITRIVIR